MHKSLRKLRVLTLLGLLVFNGLACSLGGGAQPTDTPAVVELSPTLSVNEGSGGAFNPATPISDVCSLLTISDVQTVMPGARPGAEQQTPDTADIGFWSRDCSWDVSDTSVQSIELVVFGATTEQGLAGITAAARSGTTNTPVSGLGTAARYWVDDAVNGLWALDGSLSVDVTAYYLTPMPTEAQLHPLVGKVLGEIN